MTNRREEKRKKSGVDKEEKGTEKCTFRRRSVRKKVKMTENLGDIKKKSLIFFFKKDGAIFI